MLAGMKMRLLRPGYQFAINEIDILRGDTAGISAILTATKGDAQSPEIATIPERRLLAGLPLEPEHGELAPLMPQYGNNNDNNEDDNATQNN